LGIPELDLLDGGHGAEVVRQLIKFFDTVSQTHRQLLCYLVRSQCDGQWRRSYLPRIGSLSKAFPGSDFGRIRPFAAKRLVHVSGKKRDDEKQTTDPRFEGN